MCKCAAKSMAQKWLMPTDDVRLSRFVRVLHVYGYRARHTFPLAAFWEAHVRTTVCAAGGERWAGLTHIEWGADLGSSTLKCWICWNVEMLNYGSGQKLFNICWNVELHLLIVSKMWWNVTYVRFWQISEPYCSSTCSTENVFLVQTVEKMCNL